MSIANAMVFIRKFESDASLRRECNSCKSKAEMFDMLNKREMSFTPFEFDEVINSLIFKCQTYEQADFMQHVKDWFNMFK